MTEEEAYKVLSQNSTTDVGRFYGAAADLALGTGLIYDAVRCPVFNTEDALFDTIESAGYVLTHECDVDAANDRQFGDYVVICPIIPVGAFVEEHLASFGDVEKLKNFLAQVAKRLVSRVIYLPPVADLLKFGGLIYLNNLASTHVSSFDALKPVASVSAYGLQQVDQALTNHLFRPKADRLSLDTSWTGA